MFFNTKFVARDIAHSRGGGGGQLGGPTGGRADRRWDVHTANWFNLFHNRIVKRLWQRSCPIIIENSFILFLVRIAVIQLFLVVTVIPYKCGHGKWGYARLKKFNCVWSFIDCSYIDSLVGTPCKLVGYSRQYITKVCIVVILLSSALF